MKEQRGVDSGKEFRNIGFIPESGPFAKHVTHRRSNNVIRLHNSLSTNLMSTHSNAAVTPILISSFNRQSDQSEFTFR